MVVGLKVLILVLMEDALVLLKVKTKLYLFHLS